MDDVDRLAGQVGELRELGIRRVHVLAWRDLDDDDAGGSEEHADQLMRRWAGVGLDVTHRTSRAAGLPPEATRHGYRVIRRGSRYSVFPRTVVAELGRRMGRFDALVEVWNGVPWFSPVWCRRPHIVVIHHVHGPMWDQIMPAPLARAGRILEARLAPPLYRRTAVVTPSDGTREELLELGYRPQRVTAVPNGVDPFFGPGGTRSSVPLVAAVGRMAPVKRFPLLLDAVLEVRRAVPDLRVVLAGDGPDREAVARRVEELGATSWIELPGYLDDAGVRDLLREAWVVASASLAEGWGLVLTEAAACGTPAVASDIRGHRSSVVDGATGLLAPAGQLAEPLTAVLTDEGLRTRLGHAALARARTLTWDASAVGITEVLLTEARERHRPA